MSIIKIEDSEKFSRSYGGVEVDYCVWRRTHYHISKYKTKCGKTVTFDKGNTHDNNIIICPFCGEKLKVELPCYIGDFEDIKED